MLILSFGDLPPSPFCDMQGFFGYWTPKIKKLIGELSQAESEKESKLKSILQRLVGRFSEHHNKWRQLVSTVAGTYTFPLHM